MVECEHNIMPTRITLEMVGGDIEKYKEVLYKVFQRDFIQQELLFQGKPVDIIHEKYFEDKERSFWHIISEGDEDINRTPITWRAESITWIKPLLEEDGKCEHYKLWRKYHDKTKKDRVYIWCSIINFMVILEDRESHYKLITAYPVQEYYVKKYEKEYIKYRVI